MFLNISITVIIIIPAVPNATGARTTTCIAIALQTAPGFIIMAAAAPVPNFFAKTSSCLEVPAAPTAIDSGAD